jgi:cytochrome P450
MSTTNDGLPPGSRLTAAMQTYVLWSSPFAYLQWCRLRYGDRFTLRTTGHPPFVFFSEQEDIKALFNAPADALHPGEGGKTVEPIVGPSSFMLLDGTDHLNGRKIILPAFHNKAVWDHAGLVHETVRHEVARWPRDIPISLHPRLRAMALKIILWTTFSPSGSAAEGRLSALHERLLAMLSVTGSAVFPEAKLRHGPGLRIWKRFLRARAEADEMIFSLIDERQGSIGDPSDALNMLLVAQGRDGSPMPLEQIRDNLMSIILAGHETTSSQLAWAFQLLAHHPRVQACLAEEIDRGDSQTYLTATIHEVLRHRPVFLFAIPRAVVRPFELGGFTYHPPNLLLACIYLVHHDPEIYPQPHQFRPERFLEKPLVPANAWLPWGGGRKRCPGLHLALLEMQSVLRAVLSEVTVHPAGRRMEHPRWRSVIVTPHAGCRVILRRRETPHHRVAFNRSTLNATELLHRANTHDKQTNSTV